jgi:beta-fructofuranosidase
MFYLEWSKHPRNPVIARPPDGIQATGFRDPQVWREGAEWLMA